MRHEFFPQRIRRMIEADQTEKPTPTFSAGPFLPDLVNAMKSHLRKIEEAQLRAVQEFKEVVVVREVTGNARNKIVEQMLAHRRRNNG